MTKTSTIDKSYLWFRPMRSRLHLLWQQMCPAFRGLWWCWGL